MNLENIYRKLPDKIKYNNFILNLFLNISKKIRTHQVNELNTQYELLNFIFLNQDIKAKGDLRKVQLLSLELLRFVKNVCDKHNINYWLDGGTLLGAVRHEGFIPWDDDIDISMTRKDYLKLIEVLPNEISSHELLKKNCGLTKIKYKDINYFDDFYSVYDIEDPFRILDEEKFLFLQFAWLKPYVKIDFFPRDFLQENKIDYFKKSYLTSKYKYYVTTMNKNKGTDQLFKDINENLGISLDKTNYIVDAIDVLPLAPCRIFNAEDIFPLSTLKFEGIEFKVPKNPHEILEIIYGKDFMKLPHSLDDHDLIEFIKTQFKGSEEMDKSFEESIESLKKINEAYSINMTK